MSLNLVIISISVSQINGRTLLAGYALPSSYASFHWYDPAMDNNVDTTNNEVTNHDTNTNILSSVLHQIVKSDMIDSDGDDNIKHAPGQYNWLEGGEAEGLLTSIYEDILDPVIKESIQRKEQSNQDMDKTHPDHQDKTCQQETKD